MNANPVERLGRGTTELVFDLGGLTRFAGRVLVAGSGRPWRLRRLLDEVFGIGVLSISIIGLSGLVVGLVLGLQGYNTLVRFGAEGSLGAVVAVEVEPVRA